MKTIGIICEYNPLHRGHKKQLDAIRAQMGEDCAIVCLMSGSFVQRGMPAVFDKSVRAKAAILSGADLVLELPVTYALSSAEGFAAGGVRILSDFCHYLSFGTETGSKDNLMATARALLSDRFSGALRGELDKGCSFPAARAAALEAMGLDADLLARPNDILATEYCKAILAQGSGLEPLPITRGGDYHDTQIDQENPSATALRAAMETGSNWLELVPAQARDVFASAPRHALQWGEKAILARLRTMTDAEFETLPYGSEGLWRKLMHASRSKATLDDILNETKSKRYTRTRLDRMVMCAMLGITEDTLRSPAPYTRVLAFNDKGREVLKKARQSGVFLNAGEAVDDPYWDLEQRCGDLYGLFCADGLEAPGAESRRRVYYHC